MQDFLKRAARKALRSIRPSAPQAVLRTSLSDDASYPAFCMAAALDDRHFATFRSNPRYTPVLEHVPPDLGGLYLEEIRKHPELCSALPTFRQNDDYGGPALHDYPEIRRISPTTLRYTKVLADLIDEFGFP